MRIGNLNHLATIEAYTQAVDSFGGTSGGAWATFGQAWVSILPLNGSEKYVSGEKHATATHKIRMRFLSGVNTKMRIKAKGRTFEIVSIINPGERDKELQLIVEEEADV